MSGAPGAGHGIRYVCWLAADRRQMGAIGRALRSLAPEFERGRDFCLLDWRGLERLHGPAEAAAQKLAAVAAHIGGARRAGAAVLAARAAAHFQRPCILLPAGAEAAVMAPWPVALLADDAGRDTPPTAAALAVLAAWGIRTLGQLAALPAAALHARLGETGLRLRALARGEGGAEALALAPREPSGVSWRHGFEPAIEDLAAIERALARRLGRLAAWLDRRDRMAEALELRLELEHAAPRNYTARFAPPLRQARTMAAQLGLALRRDPPPAAVAGLRLRARLTAARPLQPSLFASQQSTAPRPEATAKLMQKLAARLGPGGELGSPRLLDGHRPGAFRLEPFAYPAEAGEGPGDVETPRRPPQRAPLRGAGREGRSTLRALRPAPMARVRLDAAREPVAAAVGGEPIQPLTVRSGPWRSSGEWWAETAWDWEHWDVEIAGRRLRLRQDRRGGGWVCDGTYD